MVRMGVALGVAAAGACPPPEREAPVHERSVPGLGRAWELSGIDGARDYELVEGQLFVIGGTEVPELWRVELSIPPTLRRVPLPLDVSGRPRLLESGHGLLYLAGEWGRRVYVLTPEGTAIGAPRLVTRDRDFLPWITGEMLQVGRASRPVIVIEASVPMRGREYRRGWGGLPRTPEGALRRGGESAWGTVHIESDPLDQVHALVGASGALVRYDAFGEVTLVRRLPDGWRRRAARSAQPGYGQSLQSPANGLEISCEGHLWASAGEARQQVAVVDPGDYRLVRHFSFGLEGLVDAFWSACDGWMIGLSARTGRMVLVQVEEAPS